MKTHKLALRAAITALLTLAGTLAVRALTREPPEPDEERARVALSHALPEMDGKHLEVKMVEVNYAPGQASGPHSHPCPVLVYVTQGSIRSQVDAGPETVYKVGETIYEPPDGVHRVSANGSTTARAKLLAIFVCDHAGPLTVDVPEKK